MTYIESIKKNRIREIKAYLANGEAMLKKYPEDENIRIAFEENAPKYRAELEALTKKP